MAFDVAEVTQPVTERPDEIGLKGGCRIPQETYPGDFIRLLNFRGEQRARDIEGKKHQQQHQSFTNHPPPLSRNLSRIAPEPNRLPLAGLTKPNPIPKVCCL